jgi:hypothetical protein
MLNGRKNGESIIKRERTVQANLIGTKWKTNIRRDWSTILDSLKIRGVFGNPNLPDNSPNTGGSQYDRCRMLAYRIAFDASVSYSTRHGAKGPFDVPMYGVCSPEDLANQFFMIVSGMLDEQYPNRPMWGINRLRQFAHSYHRKVTTRCTTGNDWEFAKKANDRRNAEQTATGDAGRTTIEESELLKKINDLASKFGPIESMIVRRIDPRTIAEQTGVCLATVYNRKERFEDKVRELVGGVA